MCKNKTKFKINKLSIFLNLLGFAFLPTKKRDNNKMTESANQNVTTRGSQGSVYFLASNLCSKTFKYSK